MPCYKNGYGCGFGFGVSPLAAGAQAHRGGAIPASQPQPLPGRGALPGYRVPSTAPIMLPFTATRRGAPAQLPSRGWSTRGVSRPAQTQVWRQRLGGFGAAVYSEAEIRAAYERVSPVASLPSTVAPPTSFLYSSTRRAPPSSGPSLLQWNYGTPTGTTTATGGQTGYVKQMVPLEMGTGIGPTAVLPDSGGGGGGAGGSPTPTPGITPQRVLPNFAAACGVSADAIPGGCGGLADLVVSSQSLCASVPPEDQQACLAVVASQWDACRMKCEAAKTGAGATGGLGDNKMLLIGGAALLALLLLRK